MKDMRWLASGGRSSHSNVRAPESSLVRALCTFVGARDRTGAHGVAQGLGRRQAAVERRREGAAQGIPGAGRIDDVDRRRRFLVAHALPVEVGAARDRVVRASW